MSPGRPTNTENLTADSPVMSFASAKAWSAWLAENHDTSTGVWLKIAKKGAETDSVSYSEALDGALCYGWIDGQKRALDDRHWLQRFSPRSAHSKWSKLNRDRVARLAKVGKMKPAGPR